MKHYYAYCIPCGYQIDNVDPKKSYQCPVCRGCDDDGFAASYRTMRVEEAEPVELAELAEQEDAA